MLFFQVISGHLGWVRCIAFEPGNEWFCTGSNDRTIKVTQYSYCWTRVCCDECMCVSATFQAL